MKIENRKSKIKILFIHHCGFISGAENSLFELVTSLDRNRFSATVLLPEKGTLCTKFAHAGIKVMSLKLKRIYRTWNPFLLIITLINVIWKSWRISRIIRKEQADIVHANSAGAVVYSSFGTWKNDVPLLWHERDLRPRKLFGKIFEKHVSRIIAISYSVAENLQHYIEDHDKIKVIYNGINTGKYVSPEKLIDRETLGLPLQDRLVVMAAQIVQWKRHEDFIKAAEIVCAKFTDVVFVIAGKDLYNDHQKYLQQLGKMVDDAGLQDKIVFTGFIEDMPSFLKHVECLVLPSIGEPFGRTIAEAMAAGKPVIAINDSGPAEIIQNEINGYLVEPKNYQNLALRISQILESPEKAEEIGGNARKRIIEHFDIKSTVSEFEKLVEEVVAGK